MKILLRPLILLCAICFFCTCGKSHGSDYRLKIQGFRLTDQNGNLIGQSGPADSDWTIMKSLPSSQMVLFQFGDTVSLDNTSVGTVTVGTPFPNPVATQQMYYFSSTTPVVAKLIIVDLDLGIRIRRAIRLVPGMNTLSVDLSSRAMFEVPSSLRVLYSFSAKDHPDFMVGYGDIRICESANISDCF